MIVPLLTAALLLAGPERDNHRGIGALAKGDTTRAIASFDAAAKVDSANAVYSFNAGTAKAMAGKDGEADLGRAIDRARDPDEKARALYNRGTARLHAAAKAPQGQGDPASAISDLREALKLRPGWNDAARNLERALRLRPPPRKDKDKNQDDKDRKSGKDDKPQPKDPRKDKDGKAPPEDGQQPKPEPKDEPSARSGMDPRDAQRLLDGAAAREAQQARERTRKNREDSDGPDW